jgi:excisionase family DNA binding protein
MASTTKRLIFSATPHSDESLLGYLIRLTELNSYDTPSWILQLAGMGSYVRKGSIAFDACLDLAALARLTGVTEKRLGALMHRCTTSRKNVFGDCYVFGTAVPRIAIRVHRPKVCPACLREYGYLRQLWDLTIVTTCPLHKCLLQDECPNCRRALSRTRSNLSVCKCEYDWRQISLSPVEEAELEVTKRVHSLCNLPGGLECFSESIEFNPLSDLKLSELLSAVFFVASQYCSASSFHRKKKMIAKFGGSMKNGDIHSFLSKAVTVFRDWPSNYFSFLEWRNTHMRSPKESRGVNRDFGEFKYALYSHLASGAFDFMREGFEEYLATRWDGGYPSHLGRLRKNPHRVKRFASLREAKEMLSVSSEKIDQLLKMGKLKATIRTGGRARTLLIEVTTIEDLKIERSGLLDKKQASKRLGLSLKQIEALARCNVLTTRSPHDFRSSSVYSIKEVDALLGKLKSFVSRRRYKTVSFAHAAKSLASRGVDVMKFIKSILDGEIQPRGVSKDQGFKGLMFSHGEINRYEKCVNQERLIGTLTVREAAEVLKARISTVQFLIKHKILRAQRLRCYVRIARETISDFSSKYVLATALAGELGSSAPYLVNLLKTENINPIPRTDIDGRPSCAVFSKHKIDKEYQRGLVIPRRLVVRSPRPCQGLDSSRSPSEENL